MSPFKYRYVCIDTDASNKIIMKGSMKHTIVICMGSSCFARGNGKHLEIIEDYIEQNDLSIGVELSGCRCMGECSDGPNIIIDGEIIKDIDETSLINLLQRL